MPMSTSDSSIEMILYGVLYLIFSTPLVPLQGTVAMAICLKCPKNSTFKLMNLINCLEIGHVLCHFLSSFFLFFPDIAEKNKVVVRIIGSTLNTLWITELPLMALLAVSRIFIFQGVRYRKFAALARIMLFLIIAWMLFVIIVGSYTQNFMFSPPSWQYDLKAPYAQVFVNLEIFFVLFSLVIAYLSYLAIAYLIHTKKKGSISAGNRSSEISILVQYTFTVTYIVVYIVLWHHGSDLLDINSHLGLALVNCFWIGGAYISPVTLLILNKTVRKEFQRIIGIEKKNRVSTVLVTGNSNKGTFTC